MLLDGYNMYLTYSINSKRPYHLLCNLLMLQILDCDIWRLDKNCQGKQFKTYYGGDNTVLKATIYVTVLRIQLLDIYTVYLDTWIYTVSPVILAGLFAIHLLYIMSKELLVSNYTQLYTCMRNKQHYIYSMPILLKRHLPCKCDWSVSVTSLYGDLFKIPSNHYTQKT